jgi:hypothetical protein
VRRLGRGALPREQAPLPEHLARGRGGVLDGGSEPGSPRYLDQGSCEGSSRGVVRDEACGPRTSLGLVHPACFELPFLDPQVAREVGMALLAVLAHETPRQPFLRKDDNEAKRRRTSLGPLVVGRLHRGGLRLDGRLGEHAGDPTIDLLRDLIPAFSGHH